MDWLFYEVAKQWGYWLPVDTQKTIRKGAFYSTLIKPGFRVIALNGNYCNKANYYLALNSTDPNGQLAWLVEQLEAAEKKGEKVHIIGHIPPGGIDCLKSWSATFYDIVNRLVSISINFLLVRSIWKKKITKEQLWRMFQVRIDNNGSVLRAHSF